jgi:hypothetical protein
MERTLELMRFHGLDPRRNPVIGYHNLWVTLVGLYAAAEATVVAAPFALEALGAEAAAAAGGETLAEVIPLFAESAEAVAKAAGVVLVVWVGTRAAEAKAFTTKEVGAIVAVPVRELATKGGDALRLGSDVVYGGADYVVVGFAGARPRGTAVPEPGK